MPRPTAKTRIVETAKTADNGKGKDKKVMKLRPLRKTVIKVVIEALSPVVAHRMGADAIEKIRDKQAGKTMQKIRQVRDPEKEYKSAMYCFPDGRHGVPIGAVRECIIGAAHKDLGIEKTLVRKAVFILNGESVEIEGMTYTCLPFLRHDKPFMREDVVRVSNGGTDLRYRPQYDNWSIELMVQIDLDLIDPETTVNLIERAGFGVGLLEMRPEKGKEYGRFQVRRD